MSSSRQSLRPSMRPVGYSCDCPPAGMLAVGQVVGDGAEAKRAEYVADQPLLLTVIARGYGDIHSKPVVVRGLACLRVRHDWPLAGATLSIELVLPSACAEAFGDDRFNPEVVHPCESFLDVRAEILIEPGEMPDAADHSP